MNYYPIIRGRQYDLLALKTLAKTLSPQIIPIIEPVKDIPALLGVVKAFAQAGHPLYVIANPQVGQYGLLQKPKHALPDPLPDPITTARYFDVLPAKLVIASTFGQVDLLKPTQLAVVPNTARARALKLPQAVYLEDHYPIRSRTEDYYQVQQEFYQYSRKQLPGVGFADYPLSTHHFDEHGYPQRAIALHLSFQDHRQLWVRHFVSVNNADFQDPGAKFFEARASLKPWLSMHPDANTDATDALLALDHFPGLGTVRKLELMHWLTIMGRFLA
ncbi:sce7725 family protein [Lacticaseibacillus sp. N501-2]|uniref:sce7725 family protein n=1 Tax=Lacticaseibacillus salsurae TaxID=3367729 RepID=UPI0038B33918